MFPYLCILIRVGFGCLIPTAELLASLIWILFPISFISKAFWWVLLICFFFFHHYIILLKCLLVKASAIWYNILWTLQKEMIKAGEI